MVIDDDNELDDGQIQVSRLILFALVHSMLTAVLQVFRSGSRGSKGLTTRYLRWCRLDSDLSDERPVELREVLKRDPTSELFVHKATVKMSNLTKKFAVSASGSGLHQSATHRRRFGGELYYRTLFR